MIANAAAVGQPGALAFATASAVQQSAAGSSASDSVTNALGAHITAAASAAASGENGALAIAHALGVAQGAFASTSHFQTVVHGTADIHKTTAGTTIFGGTATAATRTFTFAPSGPATVSLDNSGTIDVSANASAVNSLGGPAVGATFTSPAFAWATALGVGPRRQGYVGGHHGRQQRHDQRLGRRGGVGRRHLRGSVCHGHGHLPSTGMRLPSMRRSTLSPER